MWVRTHSRNNTGDVPESCRSHPQIRLPLLMCRGLANNYGRLITMCEQISIISWFLITRNRVRVGRVSPHSNNGHGQEQDESGFEHSAFSNLSSFDKGWFRDLRNIEGIRSCWCSFKSNLELLKSRLYSSDQFGIWPTFSNHFLGSSWTGFRMALTTLTDLMDLNVYSTSPWLDLMDPMDLLKWGKMRHVNMNALDFFFHTKYNSGTIDSI